jgi:hypothetical protein
MRGQSLPIFPKSKNLLCLRQGLGRILGIGYTRPLVRRPVRLLAVRVALLGQMPGKFKSGGAGDGA